MFDHLSIYMADGEYVIHHLWLVMPSPFTDHPFPRSVEHIYGLSSMTYIILTFPHFCCLHLSTLRGRCWFLSSLVGFIIKITCLLLGEIWTCFRWFSSQPCLITRGDNWWFQSIEIHVFLCYFLSNNLNMNWNPYHFFPDYSSLIHVMCFFGQIMSNSSMVHVCQTTCPYKSNEIPPKKKSGQKNTGPADPKVWKDHNRVILRRRVGPACKKLEMYRLNSIQLGYPHDRWCWQWAGYNNLI